MKEPPCGGQRRALTCLELLELPSVGTCWAPLPRWLPGYRSHPSQGHRGLVAVRLSWREAGAVAAGFHPCLTCCWSRACVHGVRVGPLVPKPTATPAPCFCSASLKVPGQSHAVLSTGWKETIPALGGLPCCGSPGWPHNSARGALTGSRGGPHLWPPFSLEEVAGPFENPMKGEARAHTHTPVRATILGHRPRQVCLVQLCGLYPAQGFLLAEV